MIMAVGGWALCSYSGNWTLDTTVGMQAFPIRRADGTTDMQEFWNPGIRGIAPSTVGWYRVSWNFSVEADAQAYTNKFSVQILPQYTTNSYGSTAVPDSAAGGLNYMHTGVHMVRLTDLDSAGVIHPAVDSYTVPMRIRAAQMLVEFVGGL